MTYTETVKIQASEFERINKLLHIFSLEEMTDEELQEAGANTHHCEGVFTAHFADGSTMNYDLCSGTENYYDDVVWTSPDGGRDVIIDCEFELSDDIEVEIDGNLYIVKIEKEI